MVCEHTGWQRDNLCAWQGDTSMLLLGLLSTSDAAARSIAVAGGVASLATSRRSGSDSLASLNER